MAKLESITQHRAKFRRQTLAPLVWALMSHPILGIDMDVIFGDLTATVIGSVASVYLTLDWTDPKTKICVSVIPAVPQLMNPQPIVCDTAYHVMHWGPQF